MIRRTSVATGLMAVAVLVLGACSYPEPGVKDQFGTLSTLLEADPHTVTEAATDALEDMDLEIVSSESTELDGLVVARTAQDTQVTVTVERAGEGLSEVEIRVGSWGDQDVSMSILDEIQERLE